MYKYIYIKTISAFINADHIVRVCGNIDLDGDVAFEYRTSSPVNSIDDCTAVCHYTELEKIGFKKEDFQLRL